MDNVRALLANYGGEVRRRMAAYIPDSGSPRDYLYAPMAEYPRRGGRGMRPTLCVAAARMFGCPAEHAFSTAASIELMHNAMLIHDDIEDESEQRRGKPALHHIVGVPLAINTGDALALHALFPLLDNHRLLGPQLAMRIMEECLRMSAESAEGQALELGWRQYNVTSLSRADYLEMVLKKTCWLATILPLRAGALIGSRGQLSTEQLFRLSRLGFLIGAAFQIQDDLLNLEGDAKAYGKELDGDIYEGKRTLMLLHLLSRATEAEHQRIETFLGLPRTEREPAELRWIRERMDHYQSIAEARQLAHELCGAAIYEFDSLFRGFPDGPEKRFIRALPRWVIERD